MTHDKTNKCIRKPIVVLADTNPAQISLSSDVSNIQKISLVYFRLVNYVAPIGVLPIKPINVFMKIDNGSNIRQDLVITSNNIPSLNDSYSRLTSNIVPLHTETDSHTRFSGNDYDYLTIWGKQPKGMRWEAEDVSNFNNFTVTLYDQNLVPLRFERPGTYSAYFELVFDCKWSPPVLQSQAWKTNPIYMNSMNA